MKKKAQEKAAAQELGAARAEAKRIREEAKASGSGNDDLAPPRLSDAHPLPIDTVNGSGDSVGTLRVALAVGRAEGGGGGSGGGGGGGRQQQSQAGSFVIDDAEDEDDNPFAPSNAPPPSSSSSAMVADDEIAF